MEDVVLLICKDDVQHFDGTATDVVKRIIFQPFVALRIRRFQRK